MKQTELGMEGIPSETCSTRKNIDIDATGEIGGTCKIVQIYEKDYVMFFWKWVNRFYAV